MKHIGVVLSLIAGFAVPVLRAQNVVDCDAGAKIQDAIAKAAPGDTVQVKGTCKEDVFIPPALTQVTFDGGGTARIRATNNGFQVLGREITIRGFDISGGRNGISVLRGGTVVIDGNEIHDTGSLAIPGSGLGVNVAQKSYAALVRNNIYNNRVVAILVHEESCARIGFIDVAGTPLPNRLENNGTYGLLVSRGSEARITGAFVNRNASGGILVERGSVLEVADNEISGNGGDGITAVEGSGVVFEIGAATVTAPNRTDPARLNNGFGVSCSGGGYVSKILGGLSGVNGPTLLDGCANSIR